MQGGLPPPSKGAVLELLESLSLSLSCLLAAGQGLGELDPRPRRPPLLWLKRVNALGSRGLVFSPMVGANGNRRLLLSPDPEL